MEKNLNFSAIAVTDGIWKWKGTRIGEERKEWYLEHKIRTHFTQKFHEIVKVHQHLLPFDIKLKLMILEWNERGEICYVKFQLNECIFTSYGLHTSSLSSGILETDAEYIYPKKNDIKKIFPREVQFFKLVFNRAPFFEHDNVKVLSIVKITTDLCTKLNMEVCYCSALLQFLLNICTFGKFGSLPFDLQNAFKTMDKSFSNWLCFNALYPLPTNCSLPFRPRPINYTSTIKDREPPKYPITTMNSWKRIQRNVTQ